MYKSKTSLLALVLLSAFGCQTTPEAKTCADVAPAATAPTPAPAAPASAPADHYAFLAEQPFETGYPAGSASAVLSKELFFQRAVQTYLWALPAVNMFAMKEGLGKAAGEGYQVMSVFEKRLKPNTVITT